MSSPREESRPESNRIVKIAPKFRSLEDPLAKKVEWVTKIGHELTFLPKRRFTNDVRRRVANTDADIPLVYDDHQNALLLRMHNNINYHDIYVDRVYSDDAVIEVVSHPTKSWIEFLTWNENVRDIAKKIGLVPEVDWVGGGMGHHHLDWMSAKVRDSLFRLVAGRPYLGWLFVHPSDKINAVSIASWFIDIEQNNYGLHFDTDSCNSCKSYPYGRGQVLTCRDQTIEWRGFDSAIDMEMQVEHTAFIQALVGYAKKIARPRASTSKLFSSVREAETLLLNYTNVDKCTANFFELLKLLGLPKKRYERYIDLYLKPRIEWGNAI
jgi:hypothetical protein